MSDSNPKNEKANFISKSTIKRIMRNQGAKTITNDVLDLMIEEIEKAGKEITNMAISNMKDFGRSRLMKKDIKFAVHELPYKEWDDYQKDIDFFNEEEEEGKEEKEKKEE